MRPKLRTLWAYRHASRTQISPKGQTMTTAAATYTFDHNGTEFRADWLNDEKTRLSVRTSHAVIDEDSGIDHTDWPSDKEVSAAVGTPVEFYDAGDNGEESESIFSAVAADVSPIALDLDWHGADDATHIWWTADDGQSDMDGGPIDPARSVESQMLAVAQEMVANGCDGSGKICLR